MSQTPTPPRQTKTKLTAAVGILTMLFGALLVFAPSAGAEKVAVDKTAPFNVVYNGFSIDDNDTPGDTSDDTTTFEYELTGPAGEAVSHSVFGGFCERPSGFAPTYSEDKTIDADPTTGKLGFKWDGDGNNPVGQVYAITFDGVHEDEGTVEWSIKKGSKDGSVKSVTLAGPSCEPVDDPCADAVPGDLVCNPCVEGDQRDECDPCLEALSSDTECNPCEQGDERQECDPCRDAAPSDLQCNPCVENDTRPACSPPPTCVELGNCPPPPTCVELGNCPTPVVEPEPAELTIVKVVMNGPDEWSVPFAGDLGTFALTHLDGGRRFEELVAGAYEVSEADSGNATLASIVCDEGADATVDLDSASVTVDLAAGDVVTCTFTNVYDVNVLPEFPPIAETPPAKTPVVPAAAAATPKAEVLGKTVTRTLPRTGSSSTGTLALLGGALMLLGAALVGGSRRLSTVA